MLGEVFGDLGDDPAEIGRTLAATHARGEYVAPSLHDYVERDHVEGWSLRAALVRYAQPEPVRAAAFLELTRRTESGLDAKLVEGRPELSDLARLRHELGERADGAVDAYTDANPLPAGALDQLPVLSVAAALDALGAIVAAWAVTAGGGRPDDEVDRTCRRVHAELDRLGVERQDWYR